MDSEEKTRLFKIRRTVLQMLIARGYEDTTRLLEETLPIFMDKIKKRDDLHLYLSKEDKNEKIMVIFPPDEKITAEILKNYVKYMYDNGYKNLIIVMRKNKPDKNLKYIWETLDNCEGIERELNIEKFEENDLLVNITEHELVPKHIPLSPEEKKALLLKYKVQESQLPKILKTDPVARFYGLSKGQVVKIERNSETAGKYITYRIVC